MYGTHFFSFSKSENATVKNVCRTHDIMIAPKGIEVEHGAAPKQQATSCLHPIPCNRVEKEVQFEPCAGASTTKHQLQQPQHQHHHALGHLGDAQEAEQWQAVRPGVGEKLVQRVVAEKENLAHKQSAIGDWRVQLAPTVFFGRQSLKNHLPCSRQAGTSFTS